MGGIFSFSKEGEIINAIRLDNPKTLQSILVNNNINKDDLYTNRKRTLIQLCCYFSSPKCCSKLIEMNYDYNQKEIANDYTPLYIACKFNCLDIVKILLSKEDCTLLQKSNEDFNELEIAFIKGNYDICYYLLYEYKNEKNKLLKLKGKNNISKEKEEKKENIDINTRNIKNDKKSEEEDNNKFNVDIDMNHPYQNFFFSKDKFLLDKYISFQANSHSPLFNMKLFYDSLYKHIPHDKCLSFAAERKRTKELLTKIPDPNETWGHFFKRMINMELYNPPLVDKRNVSQMNSLYMNAQMKLLESEYGVKLSYYNPNEDTRNILDENGEDSSPIIQIQNTEKNKLNAKNITESENKNDSEVNEEDDDNTNNVISLNIQKKIKAKNPEEIKLEGKESLGVLNINFNSSDRQFRKNESVEEESQN